VSLSRRELLRASAAGLLAPLAACEARDRASADPERMNLLLLVIEDTTAGTLGCYGNPIAKTPSIDAFAASALRFDRAYCQASVCNPSRASFLTGLRPSALGIHYNGDALALPSGVRALPELLAASGSSRYSIGKIFHSLETAGPHFAHFEALPYGPPALPPGVSPKDATFNFVKDRALDLELVHLDRIAARVERETPASAAARAARRRFNQLLADVVGDSGRDPEDENDARIASAAEKLLPEIATRGERFLLAIGFARPHVPLRCPRAYLDLYDPAEMPLPEAPPEADRGVPDVAKRFGGHLDIFRALEPTPERVREVLRAYYACLSFVDAQIGRVLAALDASGLSHNTIVCLLADHGFHLGQHGIWSKRTLFEQSTRVPFAIRIPGSPHNGSNCASTFVELADLLPTLCDFWRIETDQPFQGRSLRKLCDDPTRVHRRGAITECAIDAALGRSLRTEHWRYTEWRGRRRDGSPLFERELYSLAGDPLEQENRAGRAEESEVEQRLAAWLARSGSFGPRFAT
jgi:arylsulfatase A-like enzyme